MDRDTETHNWQSVGDVAGALVAKALETIKARHAEKADADRIDKAVVSEADRG